MIKVILVDLFGVIFKKGGTEWILNKSILPIIESLKEQVFKIVLITSQDQEITEKFLSRHDLMLMFDEIVAYSNLEKKKPYPIIFNKVASLLEAQLPEMLLIDDSMETVDAARELGMRVIHYHAQSQAALAQEIEDLSGALLGASGE